MSYTNNNGQVRVGVRSGITNSPIIQPAFSASLIQSLYGVWNGDTTTNELSTSIFGAWNGESSNNVSVKNAWNANGNAIDSKSAANGTVAIPSGTTFTTGTMTYSTGKLGSGSFTFDGTNFINLPNNTLNFMGDFTVSCWFYTPADYVANGSLVSAFDNKSSYPTYYGWNFGYDSTNKCIGFSIGNPSGGSYANVALSTPNNSIVAGQWNHVAITRKFNTRSRIYINGVLSTSNTSTLNPTYNYGLAYIGAIFYGFQQPYYNKPNAGLKIDSIYTFESELDATAVSELYNSGNGQEYPFTISNALIASPKDVVGTNHGTLMNGCSFTTGKVGNAFTFDGVNDYVDLGDVMDIGLGSWSYAFWFKVPTTTGQIIFSKSVASGIVGRFWSTLTSNKLDFNLMSDGYGTITITSATTISANVWYHCALVVDRSDKLKMYINGSLETVVNTGRTNNLTSSNVENPNLSSSNYNTLAPFRIGAYTSADTITATSFFVGQVDSFTVWNRAINIDDVTQLYNLGTGTQYPFSGQTLPSTNNQLGVDNGTLMSGCTFGDGKIGKAFQFDGINDYVSLPTNSLSLGVDFSISLWVNLTSLSTRQCFVGSYNFNPSTGGMYGFRVFYAPSGNTGNTGGVRFDYGDGLSSGDGYYGSSSRALLTNNYLTTNTWYHIVVTKKSSSAQIYINGSLAASNTDYVQPTYSGNTYPTIGVAQYLQNQFDWYMSSGSKIDGINIYQKELTQADVTELYNSGNGKQITATPIVQTGLVLNLDASRKSSYTGTGTTWTDISGSGNNGTLLNGVGYSSVDGGSLTFDQINDYISLPNMSTHLINKSKFTYETWIKLNNPGMVNTYLQTLFSFGNSGQYSNDIMFFIQSNYLNIQINNGADGTCAIPYASTSWNNVCIVYDGTQTINSDRIKIYINGILQTITTTYTIPSTTTNINMTNCGIGAYSCNNFANCHFGGNIGSARLYTTSLTSTEVTQNFNATKSRFGL